MGFLLEAKMKIPYKLKFEILYYCQTAEPNEACGFVILSYQTSNPAFLPCQNVAADPLNFFEISPEEQIEAEKLGWIEAIVHSHPNGEPVLSLADRQVFAHTDCDWLLVCDDKLQRFPKIAPLVGRTFEHGKTDCYTLFKDFYFLAGLDMGEFNRPDEWWHNGQNLYLDNLEGQGFKRLDSQETLQISDVILMQVGANVPNHAGIYLGEQQVLHHSPKRLSKRDLYDGYWLKHTHSIWRHHNDKQLDFSIPLGILG